MNMLVLLSAWHARSLNNYLLTYIHLHASNILAKLSEPTINIFTLIIIS